VQSCIIHLIRNTFRLTARQYRHEIKPDPVALLQLASIPGVVLAGGVDMRQR
jgi:hypothetical protein